MAHGHLSLLSVHMVMIAVAMEYKYTLTINDLNNVVEKQPTSFGVLTSAFAAIRCSTTERCPFWQAIYSGVVPSWR